MTKLELFLLGTPQIYVDGQAITDFNTRKDRALLAYLAVTGTVHSREALAGFLWSELPEKNARRNLRHTLSHLQKVIGPQWLNTEHGVALTQNHPWSVDVHTLRSAVGRLTTHPITDTQGMDTLNQGLRLYRGEFLQGFYLHQAAHFEEWVLAQREEAHLLALRGLERLTECCLAQGEYAIGLVATRRLLQLEPWSETAHCLQMKLLAQSGRRADALVQYETCRKVLAAELGIEPLPATTALYQQIQAGKYNGAVAPRQPMPSGALALTPALPIPAREGTVPRQIVPGGEPIPNNLQTPLTGFVGRQRELALISRRLGAADCRLLTIVGPGGMGKSSLALAAAQRILQAEQADFPDGIYFISLLDIGAANDARPEQTLVESPAFGEAILRAIAEQIGYKLEAGVSATLQLQTYLRTRRLLLILDNFEHLLAEIDTIITLLTKAPQIKALVTSRARLNVRGETVLTLDKLSLPSAASHTARATTQANPAFALQDDAWQMSEAVTMFVQCAQQLDPYFAINAETMGPVGQICHLVEGLPLGIELATSMLPLLSCRSLAEALAKGLDVLAADTRDIPSEQRTLGAVFERSWRLLPSEEQRLLANLAIFPGSFHRDAAAHIAGASITLLRPLLDQSLLSKVGDERYVMHRTVHAFAQQKLQQWPEHYATLQVHYAHFYLEFLARLEQAQTETTYATTTERIQVDLDNVRTAWRWCVEQGDLDLLALSAGSLQSFYQTAGSYPEALQLLERALSTVRHVIALSPSSTGGALDAQRLLARLLCYTALFYRLYHQSGDMKKAEERANEALELGRRLADPALQALAYHELARQAQAHYNFSAMRRLAEQACTHAHQANLPQLIAESENDWGIALSLATHPLAGIQHFQAAADWLRQRPNPVLEVHIVSNLVLFHLVGHEYQAAYRYLQQRTLQPMFEDWVHCGNLLVTLGAYREAHAEFAQGIALAQTRHLPYWECWLHAGYGCLQRLCGEPSAAQSACRLALQMAQDAGNHPIAQWALINLGHALADLGDLVAAAHCYQQAIAFQREMNWFLLATDAYAGLAALGLAQNKVMTAVPHVEVALAYLAQQGLAVAREPFTVYWTCVRVLQAAHDPRAQTVLITAHQLLQETANQLEDERLRRSFLENVVANRNLVAAAQAALLVG